MPACPVLCPACVAEAFDQSKDGAQVVKKWNSSRENVTINVTFFEEAGFSLRLSTVGADRWNSECAQATHKESLHAHHACEAHGQKK